MYPRCSGSFMLFATAHILSTSRRHHSKVSLNSIVLFSNPIPSPSWLSDLDSNQNSLGPEPSVLPVKLSKIISLLYNVPMDKKDVEEFVRLVVEDYGKTLRKLSKS